MRVLNIKKIVFAFSIVVATSFTVAYAVSTDLQTLNFNYQVTGKGNPLWKPIEVFTSGGKTYIKYANVHSMQDLPDLYLKSDHHGIPQWKWEAPYVVVNMPISSAQIVDPRSGKVVYTLSLKNSAMPYIAPAPKLTAKQLAGVFVEFDLGVGGVENQKFKNPVFSGSIGYDADLTQHWLFGLGFGATYNGKSNEQGSSPNTYKIRSFDIELMTRATYLFFNGITIFGKAGLAYTIDKAVDASSGVTVPDQEKKIVPKLAIGMGYQIKSGVGFNLQLSRLFDSSTTVNANALTVGIGYHF